MNTFAFDTFEIGDRVHFVNFQSACTYIVYDIGTKSYVIKGESHGNLWVLPFDDDMTAQLEKVS